jgi:hypothetical protein
MCTNVIFALLVIAKVQSSVPAAFFLENQLNIKDEPQASALNYFSFEDIDIIKADYNGVTLKYQITEDRIRENRFTINNRHYVIYNIEGTARKEPPGSFDLPSKEIIIGIPQKGEILLSTSIGENYTLPNIEVPPVPYKTWEGEPVYVLTDTVTHPVCEIVSISQFRDNRLARIKIYPLQYNFYTKELIINLEITVAIRFTIPGYDNYFPDYFDDIAQSFIINWESAKYWKINPPAFSTTEGKSNYPLGFSDWYKIQIESTGVYKITYQELKKARIPVDIIDPRTIRIFNIGEYTPNIYYPDTLTEIPIEIMGEEDGRFDRNDYILFYALGASRYRTNHRTFYNNPFTKYNYYWLTWGISPCVSGFGKRINMQSASIQGTNVSYAYDFLHLEKDRDCPARNGLLWIWEYFSKEVGIINKSYNVRLDIPNAETLLSISGRLYGKSFNNRISLQLNNYPLGTFSFSGAPTNPPPFDFEINISIPLGDNNSITFTLEGDALQEIYLDYLECRYKKNLEFSSDQREITFYSPPGNYNFTVLGTFIKPLILNITDYYNPQMINDFYRNRDTINFGLVLRETCYFYVTDETRARKVLKIERRNVGRTSEYDNAQYYIITHDELYNSALLLEYYRTNNISGIPGARVKTVPLSQIYDNFTFGVEEPGAIKRFFKRYRPYYGLLLGDGTYDYRNILGVLDFPAVPSYEAGLDIDFQVYSANAIALDAWYADFDGNGRTPDMILGRVTVRNSQEVRQFYDKVVNYECGTSYDPWNKRILLLSDDEWKGQGTPDEFRFEHISNNENLEFSLYNAIPSRFKHYEPVKIYLTEYPFSESRDKRMAREKLIEELNRGVALLCFFGHGAGFQLCHEQVLHLSYIPLITNGRKNFIGFFGSCGVGRFEDTKYESVAEELVRRKDGAIVTVAASKATYSTVNYAMAIGLFRNLINNTDSTIGASFLRIWAYDSTYHFFGDPATIPALPKEFKGLTIIPDTFKSRGVVFGQIPVHNDNPISISISAGKWLRIYQSELGTITYVLSGYEIFRGITRRVTNDTDSAYFNFTVPMGIPRTVRYDVINGGGYYSEIPNSSRISAFLYDFSARSIVSYLKDSIPFDTNPVPNYDSVGPKIKFFRDNDLLDNFDSIPQSCIISIYLEDSSGILLVPVPGYTLRLTVSKSSNVLVDDIDATFYFAYDLGKFNQGRIRYFLQLDTGQYIIAVRAADNLCNLSVDSIIVNVLGFSQLQISNALFYTSPRSNDCYFTFELSHPADVRLRIYSLSGRLVYTSDDQFCHEGYNQIYWNRISTNNYLVGNGVYLYKIHAISYINGKKEERSFIDKFILYK